MYGTNECCRCDGQRDLGIGVCIGWSVAVVPGVRNRSRHHLCDSNERVEDRGVGR